VAQGPAGAQHPDGPGAPGAWATWAILCVASINTYHTQITESLALGQLIEPLHKARQLHRISSSDSPHTYVHYASLAALLRAAGDLIHIVPVPFQTALSLSALFVYPQFPSISSLLGYLVTPEEETPI
jgi:hypothetical protein